LIPEVLGHMYGKHGKKYFIILKSFLMWLIIQTKLINIFRLEWANGSDWKIRSLTARETLR
jgi:hypothetical protein